MPRTPKDDTPKKLSLVPKAPTKAAAKKKAKRKPKPAKQDASLDGPRPLTDFDLRFCHIYVQTGKYVEGIRQQDPECKDPYKAANRMMERTEIRDHIKDIFRAIAKKRSEAVEISARASVLSLELADDRLTEILQQPRRTLGHMLGRDTRQILGKGVTMVPGAEEGDEPTFAYSEDLIEKFEGPAPVEDSDLLKAIDLTYKRKGGIIKHENTPAPTHTTVMLYKPKWFNQPRQAPDSPTTIEAAHG